MWFKAGSRVSRCFEPPHQDNFFWFALFAIIYDGPAERWQDPIPSDFEVDASIGTMEEGMGAQTECKQNKWAHSLVCSELSRCGIG